MFNKKTKPTSFGGEMRDVASKTIDNDNDTFTDSSTDAINGTFGASSRQPRRETRHFDLDLLSQEELNSLMSEVSSRITNKRLADRNLEREFEAQLNLAKRIQEDLLTFEAEPKEKISALNAVGMPARFSPITATTAPVTTGGMKRSIQPVPTICTMAPITV